MFSRFLPLTRPWTAAAATTTAAAAVLLTGTSVSPWTDAASFWTGPLRCQQQDQEQDQTFSWKHAKQLHYEHRIRQYSHPFKVFQYFASLNANPHAAVDASEEAAQQAMMTPWDLVRALLPFHEGLLEVESGDSLGTVDEKRWEKSVNGLASLLDSDNSRTISLDEFLFLLILVSTQDQDWELAFKLWDTNRNGRLDYDEFSQIISSHRNIIVQSLGTEQRSNHVVNQPPFGGLLAKWFGSDGKNTVSLSTFQSTLRELKTQLMLCEFYRYPVHKQSISPYSFACALIHNFPPSQQPTYLSRLSQFQEQPSDPQGNAQQNTWTKKRVSFDEFQHVFRALGNRDRLLATLRLFGEVQDVYEVGLNREMVRQCVHVATGEQWSDNVLDVLFQLLDTNGDGTLDRHELGVLFGNGVLGWLKPRDTGLIRSIQRLWRCWRHDGMP